MVPDSRSEGQESTADQTGYLFLSFGFEVTSTGVQTATSSDSTDTGAGFDDGIMATFYNSVGSSGGGNPTSVFMGRVKVVGSAPAGNTNPYIGTVKVVGSAPAGEANPYLGRVVVIGSAPVGEANPTLGEIVIVSGLPDGFEGDDPFLGSIVET